MSGATGRNTDKTNIKRLTNKNKKNVSSYFKILLLPYVTVSTQHFVAKTSQCMKMAVRKYSHSGSFTCGVLANLFSTMVHGPPIII